MKKSISRPDLLAWLLIACFGVTMVFSLNTTMYYSPDSANYLGWAKSIAFFHGYELTYGPEISRYVVNAPLYPVLLAPIARFFPLDVTAAKLLTLGFGIVLLLLFYRYTSIRTGAVAALLGLLLLATNPQTALFSTQVLSDVPFGVCMMLVLIVVERLVKEDKPPDWLFWVLVGLLTSGILLREIGFALLLAVVVFFALRKDYVRAGLLLVAPILIYFAWYIRNEVIVANIEFNDLRNTRLFFSHALTGSTGTLADEFVARIRSNLAFYAMPLGNVLFISQHVGWIFPVVNFNDPTLASVQSLADTLTLPIMGLTLLLVVHGFVRLWKTEPTGRLIGMFLVFYASIILLYPINDYRFLFPPLLLMTYLATISMRRILDWVQSKKGKRVSSIGLTAFMVILLAPNIVWLRNFVTTAAAYKHAPETLYAEIRNQPRYPIEYTKDFPQVDEWITRHSPPSAVIVSRYKEAALWLGGRKLLTLDPLVSPEDFEVALRDYRSSFIIAYMVGHQLHDFEFQMAVSRRFQFEPAFRAGDVQVLRVHPRIDSAESPSAAVSDSGGEMRQQLIAGIRAMENGNYGEAASAFGRLRVVDGFEATGTFYSAVVAELSGNLVEARKLFRESSLLPQSGTLLLQAQAHQEIITSLEGAMKAISNTDRASFYHSASLSYWLLGFRRQAGELMQKCIAADSTYFIGPVFAALYDLQNGDIRSAERFVDRARHIRPGDPLVASLHTIMTAASSLQHASDPRERASLLVVIGKEFMSLGLNDFAIEDLVQATELDPTNGNALRHLGDLYILKRRFAPAAATLSRLLDIEPADTDVRRKLETIREERDG